MTRALVLEDVSRTFAGSDGPLAVLDGVTLDIAAGERVAVVGPSGSGKSTLLGLVAGLDRPSRGRVLVEGTDLAGLAPGPLAEFRGRRIGFVFQGFRLLPTLSALENVRVPLDLAGRADAAALARDWLDRVGLGARLHHLPARLSGGEQQRVAIARALAPAPALIVADEPTGNLDARTGAAIADLLFSAADGHGATLLLVTHDEALAARAHRTVRLRDGRMVDP
jgi:putative ABC transport system ATP-binding protein